MTPIMKAAGVSTGPRSMFRSGTHEHHASMNHSCWLFLVVTVAMPAGAQSPAPGEPDPYPSVAFGPPPDVVDAPPRRPAAGQSRPPEEQGRQRNALAFTIKTGYVKLADDSQTISGNDWLFKRSASIVVGIEGEKRLSGEARNFSVGGELLHYENDYAAASAPGTSAGTVHTNALLLKAKYYFMPENAWQPYIGGGLALVGSDDYSGPLHSSVGPGVQGVVGMLWRIGEAGLRVEYIGRRGRLGDSSTGILDPSSRGLFIGVSFLSGGGGRSQPEVKTKDTRRIEVPRF